MSVNVLYLACVSLVIRYEKEKLWLVGGFSFLFWARNRARKGVYI